MHMDFHTVSWMQKISSTMCHCYGYRTKQLATKLWFFFSIAPCGVIKTLIIMLPYGVSIGVKFSFLGFI